MVENARLVVTSFRYQPRPKTPSTFRKSLLPASSGTLTLLANVLCIAMFPTMLVSDL